MKEELNKLIKKIYNQAKKLDACDLIKGDETLEDLVGLLTHPDGWDFCCHKSFPNPAVYAELKRFADMKKFNIYINEGNITFHNPEKPIILVGRTTATINVDTDTYPVTIYSYLGAKCIINSSGWSVVEVHIDKKQNAICNRSDKSIILI